MDRLAVGLLTAVALASCGARDARATLDARSPDHTVFAHTAALDYLPASTLAVAAVRRAALWAVVTGEPGTALLLPGLDRESGSPWLGLDPERPMGVAVLDLESGTTVSFAAIADPGPLLAALRQRPGIEAAAVDGTPVYTAADAGIGFVVRGDQLFVVRSQAASKRARAEVALAAREPDRGLVSQPGFQAVRDHLGVGRDAVAYVAAGPVGERVAELYEDRIEAARDSADRAADELRQARAGGAPADELAALQTEAAVAALGLDEMRRSAGIRVQAARDLLAGWGRVAVGIDGVEGGGGLGGDGPGGSPVLVGLSIQPRPSSRIAELLTAPSARRVEQLVTLLGQVSPVRWLRVDQRYLLTAGSAELTVALSGSALVVTSQPGAVERAGSGAGSRTESRIESRDRPAVRGPVAAAVELDAHLWFELFHDRAPDPPAPRELPEFGNDDVPLSDAYRALVAEWHAASRRIGDLTAQRAALERERRRALSGPLGTLSLTVVASDSLFIGRGRLRLGADDPTSDLASVMARIRALDRDFVRRGSELDRAMRDTLARLDELQQELLRVRARDVEAWDRR